MTRNTILAGLLASAIACPAFATDITIENFVGKVVITDGTDGVEVLRKGKYSADIKDGDDDIRIDGDLSSNDRNDACKGPGMGWNLNWNGRDSEGNTRLKDYPDLRLHVPAGSNLTIKDSYVELTTEVTLGDLDLDIGGCFDIEIDAAEMIRLDKSGSGDIEIGETSRLILEKSGSGDIDVGRTGPFDMEKSGSGDVTIDRINGYAKIEKSGSGDLDIGEMDGDFDVQKSGSGDIEVGGGKIGQLDVRNSGSGDTDIDAAVGDAFVRASGSGDVYVRSISGNVDASTSGAADFRRGDD